jgi:hypothetical protein
MISFERKPDENWFFRHYGKNSPRYLLSMMPYEVSRITIVQKSFL